MISSTSLDLPKHRQKARDACEEMLCLPRMMEHLPASDPGALSASLALVDEADIYIGVFAYRYGHIPKGQTKSITHMEYERALKRGIPVLIFLMSPDHRVKPEDIETGEGAERLRALKKELESRHVVKRYRSPSDLHARVLLGLTRVLEELESQLPASAAPLSLAPAPLAVEPPDPKVVRAARRELFRIETSTRRNGPQRTLVVDLGFSRISLRGPGGRRLPVVCGCSAARSEVRFRAALSSTDPTCDALPAEARLIVQFGTGPRPIVRLETNDGKPFLEGRTRLVFAVEPEEPGKTRPPDGEPPSGEIVVIPEFFGSAPAPGSGAGQPIPEEIQALLDAWLKALEDSTPPSSPFTF
jgi:hypothetical protein